MLIHAGVLTRYKAVSQTHPDRLSALKAHSCHTLLTSFSVHIIAGEAVSHVLYCRHASSGDA